MIFFKDIRMIYLRYHLSAAQAGSLCYQIPWDRLTESQGKETFARGSNPIGAPLRFLWTFLIATRCKKLEGKDRRRTRPKKKRK